MPSFENTPLPLRQLRQWVMWRYENVGQSKPTKVPHTVDGRRASSTNEADWSTFNKCVNKVHEFDGIGFVFTKNDPYCVIDLDHTIDDAHTQQQVVIETELASYSELSPSGKGLHIIIEADLETGRNCKPFEIYSHSRFITMTGNVYNSVPIVNRQELATKYWNEWGSKSAISGLDTYSRPVIHNDLVIYERAVKHNPTFLDLWNGNFIHMFPRNDGSGNGDQSRADQALMNMLCCYSKNRDQVTRMFRQSALGQRDKAQRGDYIERTITKGYDRTVDVDKIRHDLITFLEQRERDKNRPPPVVFEKLNGLEYPKFKSNFDSNERFVAPPGLVGQIAKFIYNRARKPVFEIAVVGALGLLAGLAGKAYNVDREGLNLYLLMLAETGRGKNAMTEGITSLIETVAQWVPEVKEFSGYDMASGEGLMQYLGDHPTRSCVSVFPEFGIKLQSIVDDRPGPGKSMNGALLKLYSLSGHGKIVPAVAYSDSRRNLPQLDSPAFSLIGESVPSMVYDAFNTMSIVGGLLPRFIICEYDGIRVPDNYDGVNVIPSQEIVQGVINVITQAYSYFRENRVHDIQYTPSAFNKMRQYNASCDAIVNAKKDLLIHELWNRAGLNSARIAGLLAVGINYIEPVIDDRCWDWAESFVTMNINKLQDGFRSGRAALEGDDNVKQAAVITAILRYLDLSTSNPLIKNQSLKNANIVPYSYLCSRLRNKSAFRTARLGPVHAIKSQLIDLVDCGYLIRMSVTQLMQTYSYSGEAYVTTVEFLADHAGP